MIPPPLPPIGPTTDTPLPALPQSKLSKVAFVISVLALLGSTILAGTIFPMVVGEKLPDQLAIRIFLGFWFSGLLGFLGALLGAIPLRRMRGPAPAFRGRTLTLIAVIGPRALLLATSFVFGSIWLAHEISKIHRDKSQSDRILNGLLLITFLLISWYVGASIRRVRRAPTNKGWLLFTFGLVFHLALVISLPFPLAGAFMARHENLQVGQDQRQRPVPQFGTYSTRDLWVDLPSQSESQVTLRHWSQGQVTNLLSRKVRGTNLMRWTLSSDLLSGPHTVNWQLSAREEPGASISLPLPEEITLVPASVNPVLTPQSGATTRFWLFFPTTFTAQFSTNNQPEYGLELLIEAGN